MKHFIVYQQGLPLIDNHNHLEANLKEVAELEAEDSKSAFAAARKMPIFRIGHGLGRWPILEEVDESGEPVIYREDDRILHYIRTIH
jgi:hypothetical protein